MKDSGLEPSIFKFIFRHSKKEQIFVTVMTGLLFPILYYTLELPKIIINEAIGGTDFPADMFGFEFGQVEFLLVLCFAFLALVLISGGLKFYVNVYRGRLGERMLRRLRFELYSRVLRFPLPHFKKLSSGEIIPMITAEVEPLGGFIGDALALPMLQGGTLVTYMAFIFIQDFWLGLAAISLYPFQMYLIPKLQKTVNQLAKRRVRTVRSLSDRIGESVAGASEIHANDGSRLMRADIANRLNTLFEIRYDLFRRKFFIKFLNNFIGQLTPFFFYSIGGYFVIQGDLSFGALVAVIAAYKDLASPWKELLAFYQLKEDVRIKYEQVVEQFEPEGMLSPDLRDTEPDPMPELTGKLEVSNLQLTEDGRVFQVAGASFAADATDHIAIVGGGGSGKEDLSLLLARLLAPTGGSIQIGTERLSDLPETVTGRRIGYVGPNAFMFSASVFDNLTFGLKHRPLVAPDYDDEAEAHRRSYIKEAEVSANIDDDPNADWIDYAAAGADGKSDLYLRAEDVLKQVDLETDIYGFGLRGTIDPAVHPELADRFLEGRLALRDRLASPEMRQLVEPFDVDSYNTNATLAENLLFGTPTGTAFDLANLAENPYLLSVLDSDDLTTDLVRVGHQVATTMVELFAGLPPGHEFFAQYSFIESDELPEVQALVSRVSLDRLDELKPEERTRLLSLPFVLVEKRHRLDLIDDHMKARILKARHDFAERLPDDLRGEIEFFDAESYNAAATIQDNILFGKLVYGQAQGEAKVRELITQVVDELNLRDEIIFVGLNFDAGIAGSRLSAAQRQKVAIGRCLLKQPDIMIINEATASLDSTAQAKVMAGIMEARQGKGLIWGLHRASLARDFDRVIVMATGNVVEQGTVADLDKDGTAFRKLVEAE
jgi:ABC-type multidrug transport system fused ATPase/permease subunit